MLNRIENNDYHLLRQAIKDAFTQSLESFSDTEKYNWLNQRMNIIDQFSKDMIKQNIEYHHLTEITENRLKLIARTFKLKLRTLSSEHKKQFFHKNNLYNYLEGIFRAIPIALKKIKNNDRLQRRMNSLARILSLSSQDTPCIAVAFIESKLYIATNTPPQYIHGNPMNKVETVKKIGKMILKKMHVLS